jgi:beta-fructofuranosidase
MSPSSELEVPILKPLQKSITPRQSQETLHIDEKVLPHNPSQWRPSFHLTAPGWLNDPCGLGYDSKTGLYHLSFQWNPHGNDWGNISWGHATSPDLVSWRPSRDPILTPTAEYDCRGVFTGCLRATDLSGKPGALTILYTSVKHLPIHHTLPYTYGSESLSLAVSRDGGKNWERQDCNPILTGPPTHLDVTGWRDPGITTWAGGPVSDPCTLYGFISGGIAKKTPTVFVYTVDPTDLRKWDFLGPLVDIDLNLRPSRWSGDLGVNWEVANLMTLGNEIASRDFVIMGAEGCLPSNGAIQNEEPEARRRREARGQLWVSVKPNREPKSTGALASYAFSGIFDHGCFYAANSFYDTQTAQQIVFGWITEEDLSDSLRHRQGFSGLISLPRVVGLMTLKNVKKARKSALRSITSIEAIPDVADTFTIQTMKISPDSRLVSLRQNAQQSHRTRKPLSALAAKGGAGASMTSRWEIDAEFSVGQFCSRVGITIPHTAGKIFSPLPEVYILILSPDGQDCTTISWHPHSETFTIHRPQIENKEVNHGYETAPHTLFTFCKGGEETEETLRIHAFFDSSVLEVFVNERTVISTRIYHPSNQCFEPLFFADSDSSDFEPAVLLRADIWDGLGV